MTISNIGISNIMTKENKNFDWIQAWNMMWIDKGETPSHTKWNMCGSLKKTFQDLKSNFYCVYYNL